MLGPRLGPGSRLVVVLVVLVVLVLDAGGKSVVNQYTAIDLANILSTNCDIRGAEEYVEDWSKNRSTMSQHACV